ncbi:MAG: helix-turn-helix domain-containing protein [Oxalobacteraceae bacterium]|nr:MAG: helix-turn-helix domain-containing protein [Oxalobacteraceae bacterium]
MKNRLKELRAERGWSQIDLAAKLQVSRQTVNANLWSDDESWRWPYLSALPMSPCNGSDYPCPNDI